MMKLPIFKNQTLWLCALTHRSYVNECSDVSEHNERLEFLGDAILSFLVGELLYQTYPKMTEAQLTRLRANLVDETQLSKLAKELKLGELLRLGKGAIKDGARNNTAILCDVFEAMIGAYYLDAGIEAVKEYVESIFTAVAAEIILPESETEKVSLVDSKNRFQQWALANFTQNPEYVIISESGLDHAKEFIAIVKVKDKVYGKGKGKRKQEATKAAAEDALKQIELRKINENR
ncbi:ribonuclease III [Aphanothece hegewaldii CCALA 016]|uniref:Ribonuclease 3 n=1 Tax=Aphanothece hegewaldii CCALA 016 TaxID=2107694 RepID=A0A2T1M355_9CHRO|nr:ribonuclease III [Aphanothece hegewaldii]PSF39262.1 ribonuclease III [Aphanothece hegewaldii CCALA 016]